MLILKTLYSLKSRRFYYGLWLRYIFISYKYIVFYSSLLLSMNDFYELQTLCLSNNIGFRYGLSSKFLKVSLNKRYLNYFKNKLILIYFNDFLNYQSIDSAFKEKKLVLFSFSIYGYLLNVKYLGLIKSYYLFYNNNYLLIYIYIISFWLVLISLFFVQFNVLLHYFLLDDKFTVL